MVLFGELDFATNAHLSAAGNSQLLMQALDWLTLDESLVTVSARIPSLRLWS